MPTPDSIPVFFFGGMPNSASKTGTQGLLSQAGLQPFQMSRFPISNSGAGQVDPT